MKFSDLLGAPGVTTVKLRQEIFALGGRHLGDPLAGALLELKDPELTPERRSLLRAVVAHLTAGASHARPMAWPDLRRRSARRPGKGHMTVKLHERRQELLALEPRLRDCADTLTRDAAESQALVLETLRITRAPDYDWPEGVSTQVWIFRLLRQRFYSVERDRDYRRSRSAAVTELGYARKRALQAQAAEDASDVR